jgi:hypothetical protein
MRNPSLNLVLYPVIFETAPQARAESIARELFAASQPGGGSMFTAHTLAELRTLLAEVRAQLALPELDLRGTYGLACDEPAAREYLAQLAQHLGKLVGG